MTKEEIIAWIKKNLGDRRGAAAALAADVPGLDEAKVSKILKGNREVSAVELLAMANHFRKQGMSLPGGEVAGGQLPPLAGSTLLPIGTSRGQVPMIGRIGEERVWIKPSEISGPIRWVNGMMIEDYPIEQQSAYELDEATTDGEYRARDLIYTVPFQTYRAKPVAGDEVVVQRDLDGFRIFSLRVAVATDNGVILTPLHSSQTPPSPAEHETIVGLVIGFFRPKRVP